MYMCVCGVYVCCVYVCICVCVVCVYVCVCGVYMDMHVWVCGCVWVYVCMYRFVWCVCVVCVCVCVCMSVCGVDPPSGSQSAISPLSFSSLAPCLPVTPCVFLAYLFLVYLLHWLLWIRSRRPSCCTLISSPACVHAPCRWWERTCSSWRVGFSPGRHLQWVQVGRLPFGPLSCLFGA